MVAVDGFNVRGRQARVVGFTNEDAPTLVFPGAFDPVLVRTRWRWSKMKSTRSAKNGKVIVVMGHDGATAGTLTEPTGPLVDLADAAEERDVVIGDHTNFQVARPAERDLVVENRVEGRPLHADPPVLDTSWRQVVYKTADFH